MDSDINNYENDEYIEYCDVSDNLCKERFFKNHLKSQTQNNFFT